MRTNFSRNAILPLLAVVLAVPVPAVQDEGPGAKRVNTSGKVIDSVTGRPIPGLHLHMQCSTRDGPGGDYEAEGGEQGVFTFVGVPDTGCWVSIDGRRLSSDYQYHINGSEEETPWIIRLIPGVVISGTVLDEKGMPIESARVHLDRSAVSMGMRMPAFADGQYTDGHGRFRFEIPQEHLGYRFDEDRYRLCVEFSPRGAGQRAVYPLTCYPGVSDWRAAEWIELHPGQFRDFKLRLASVPGGQLWGKSPVRGPSMTFGWRAFWIRSGPVMPGGAIYRFLTARLQGSNWQVCRRVDIGSAHRALNLARL
jgi:hypothetical protein